MNLEDIVESELNQADRVRQCALPHVPSKRDDLVEVESRVLVTPDGGWKKREDVSQKLQHFSYEVGGGVGGGEDKFKSSPVQR